MEAAIEQKLQVLWDLQTIHTKVDKLRTLRGELPIEVRDLEDEVAGLETRIARLEGDIEDFNESVSSRKHKIKEAQDLIKKYESQQNNVKNNREFEVLQKEIELLNLDIQVNEKRIRETQNEIQNKKLTLEHGNLELVERQKSLIHKKEELTKITAETKIEEEHLLDEAKEKEKQVEERLLNAYHRLRANMKNGLAVATITRNSCSGCFNKIPPQRQADIRQRKKVIVCEHCGRIVVDSSYAVEAI